MLVQKKTKAFAYRVPIGDYNYLQCTVIPGPTSIPDSRVFSRHNVFSRITAKISKSDSFSTLSNHQLIILNGRKNSWMVMSATHYEKRFTKLKSFGIN